MATPTNARRGTGFGYVYPPFVRDRGALGLLVLRVVAGAALVLHGWPKIANPFGWMPPEQNTPGFLQALAALAEFGGGIALLLGFLTPLAALGSFFVFLVAILNTHIAQGHPFVAPGGEGPSYESAALHLAIAATFLLAGPGAYSLDRWLLDKRRAV